MNICSKVAGVDILPNVQMKGDVRFDLELAILRQLKNGLITGTLPMLH